MTRKNLAGGIALSLSLCCSAAGATSPSQRTWMMVDLVSGIVSYHDYDFTTATNVFNTEEYKSTKMAFRRVQAGDGYYVQNGAYTAQMTNSYYIGLFEVTEAQYALMKSSSYGKLTELAPEGNSLPLTAREIFCLICPNDGGGSVRWTRSIACSRVKHAERANPFV